MLTGWIRKTVEEVMREPRLEPPLAYTGRVRGDSMSVEVVHIANGWILNTPNESTYFEKVEDMAQHIHATLVDAKLSLTNSSKEDIYARVVQNAVHAASRGR